MRPGRYATVAVFAFQRGNGNVLVATADNDTWIVRTWLDLNDMMRIIISDVVKTPEVAKAGYRAEDASLLSFHLSPRS